MLAYYGTRLSPHMDKTPEGYLICRDVPIARTGAQEYLAAELGLDGDPERLIPVNRRPEDVFAPAALASFEGKDVTKGHPPENVGPENFSAYSRGHVQNVRREGGSVVADLLIKDASLIADVESGVLREVSCGYLCDYVPDGAGYKQANIRGNHVAVVPRGRAGREIAIHDSAEHAGKGKNAMSKFAETILSAFGMAAKDARDDQEMSALVTTAMTALDAAPDGAEAAPTAGDEGLAGPAAAERAPERGGLEEKLDKVIELLADLQPGSEREEETLRSERDLDELIERLADGQPAERSVTIQEDEAARPDGAALDAAALMRMVRPAVAGISDEKERSRVVDALIATVKGPNVMGRMMQAAAANARRAADAAQASTFEERCRASEAAYAARNPHKKKEEN